MPLVQWQLSHGRPTLQVELNLSLGGAKTTRMLLADTGAGGAQSAFELLLDENDCLLCGSKPSKLVPLGGAYSGIFPLYRVRVAIPALGFVRNVQAVGVPNPPTGFDGIACFRFLNRFTYGNFGNPGEFGLEN